MSPGIDATHPTRIDILLVALLLLLLARPRVPYIVTTAELGSEFLVPTMAYYFLTGAIAVVGVLRAARGLREQFVARHFVAPIVFALWATASIVWSVSPAVSARFVFQFALVLILAMALTCGWRLSDLVRMLSMATTVLLVYSLAWIVLEPSWGLIETYVGDRWRGAFANQNALGRWAGLGLIIASGRLFAGRGVLWPLAMGAVSLALVVGTGSAQALGISLAIVVITALGTVGRRFWGASGRVELLGLASVGFIGGWAVLLLRPDVQATLTSALSGRDGLWNAVLPSIGDRFLLGFGAGAFWQSPDADTVRRVAGFPASHAHNTYLEVALQLGIPFALVFLLFAVGALWKTLRGMYAKREEWAYWCVFSFLALYSLSASMILTGALEWWFVLVAFVGNYGAASRFDGDASRAASKVAGDHRHRTQPSLPTLPAKEKEYSRWRG